MMPLTVIILIKARLLERLLVIIDIDYKVFAQNGKTLLREDRQLYV